MAKVGISIDQVGRYGARNGWIWVERVSFVLGCHVDHLQISMTYSSP